MSNSRDAHEFDPAHVLEMVDNDTEVLHEILTLFVQSYQSKLKGLEASIREGSGLRVQQQAHHFRGELVTMGVFNGALLLEELEKKGKSNNLDGAGEILSKVERDIQPLVRYIEKVLTEKRA